jgi:AcrR family transcriptional regulator
LNLARHQQHGLRPPVTQHDMREIEQIGAIRFPGIHDLKHRLKVPIEILDGVHHTFELQRFVALIPPAMRHAFREEYGFARAGIDASPANNRGQAARGHASFFVLTVVDVHRRAFSAGRQRAPKGEDERAATLLPSERQRLAGVPIVQAQVRRIWRIHGRLRRFRGTLDTMSSAKRHRKRQLDTVSSRRGDPATRRRICEAALRLVSRRGGGEVTLATVARAAGVSRQALYLHFANRGDLFVALVQYADEQRGLSAAIQRIEEAASGLAALREMAAQQAKLNPAIWPLARLIDSIRREDAAAERSWQDRLAHRFDGCRGMVARLEKEHTLRPGLDPGLAADLLWTFTSLRMWEDLVLLRGWTAAQYEERVTKLLVDVLVRPDLNAGQ